MAFCLIRPPAPLKAFQRPFLPTSCSSGEPVLNDSHLGLLPSTFYVTVLPSLSFINLPPLQPLAALPAPGASVEARCALSSQEGVFDLVHILTHTLHSWAMVYAQVHLGIWPSPAKGTSKSACVIYYCS